GDDPAARAGHGGIVRQDRGFAGRLAGPGRPAEGRHGPGTHADVGRRDAGVLADDLEPPPGGDHRDQPAGRGAPGRHRVLPELPGDRRACRRDRLGLRPGPGDVRFVLTRRRGAGWPEPRRSLRSPFVDGPAEAPTPGDTPMRALRKTGPGPGAELVEVPVPAPGPNEVLVRVQAASICGTDLHIYEWNEWAARRIGDGRLPYTFGHEVAGRVVAVGDEVDHPLPGAFVAAETHLFCGHCGLCRTGKPHICQNMKILGVDVDGAFADYLVLPAHNAWVVDPRIPVDIASTMEPFGNAVHTVFPPGTDPEVATSVVAVLGC